MSASAANIPPPACIAPLSPYDGPRPFWSVVIPVRNRLTFRRQAIESVFIQAPQPTRMEIILVDNSEQPMDFGTVLSPQILSRVRIHRQTTPLAMIDNWNSCINISTGELVHLLHDDDWVKPGFYATVETLSLAHPELHFFAVRTLHVDADGERLRIVDRFPNWEKPTHDPSLFFHANHVQCPAVVMRRSLYEKVGGFRPGLPYSADCEMWARAIACGGGILSPSALACYRVHDYNASGSLLASGEWLRDHKVLRDVFTTLYSSFDPDEFNHECTRRAFALIRRFESERRVSDADANRRAWGEMMPAAYRRKRLFQAVVLRLLRPPLRALGLHLDRA